MNILFFGLTILGTVLIGGSIIAALIRKKKKVKKVPVIQPRPLFTPPPGPEDEDHPNIMMKSSDHQLYEKFMQEYDSGEFKFDDVGYRKGAKNTCSFGISEGFKYDAKGKMKWGYVRLHTGVDRARGGEIKGVKDIVQIPFNFDESAIIEYKNANGEYYGYGTLILLTNKEYGFQMRIAHMDPKKDIIPWSYDRLKKGLGFQAGWLLGSAGTCGASSGNHTHTEFLSTDESCEVFDILLEEKYGDKTLVDYTKSEIIREYKKQEHFKNASDRTILKDWQAVKEHRGAMLVNKYKYTFKNKYGNKFTRYASNLLFNGL